MDGIYGLLFVLLIVALGLFLIFLFIKAAVKSAIRDIMEEQALKKLQEEEKQSPVRVPKVYL